METEFKYKLESSDVFDSIVNSDELSDYLNKDAVETIDMHAVYFDTEDNDLRDAGIAYRIRYENDRITATIKWDINVEEGLHVREEFNLVINDERFAENPNIEVFKSSDAYDVLYRAAGDKKLVKTVEMNFDRRLVKIDTGKSISALSIDQGIIQDYEGEPVPVCEMELEWYYGDEDDFNSIAEYLSEKYNLVAENESKLQRAFRD
ncbi:MAG: inorganic triphosphatase [Anaerovoracaceae bacterium]